MSRLLSTVRRHLVNIPGKRLDKKYIIFESDDWGSERIPSVSSLKYLVSRGFDAYKNPFNHLDSLETGDDLSALFEVLTRFRDKSGNHPVITANFVMANPDFVRIKASGLTNYHFIDLLKTYETRKDCKKSFELTQEGMAAGIFYPQFHGREHLNVKQWLRALNSGNRLLLEAFEAGVYAIDLETEFSGRPNFTASFDGETERDNSEYDLIIEEGTGLFNDIFGFVPRSFIAPCYVWHPSLERILNKNGIQFLQGLPYQYSPSSSGGYRKIFHYQGQRNNFQQHYFIRNCFFEPSLNQNFSWIDDCLERLKTIFFWGKPAIIGTHRLNFTGSLDENNRKRNLEQFSVLLAEILRVFPDIEFTTTDKLGDIYLKH